MKYLFFSLCCITALFFYIPNQASGQFTPAGPLINTNTPTTVTADSMDADLAARTAVFKGNVEVISDAFHMTSDEMIVSFGSKDESSGVQRIVARGRVKILQQDKSAEADEADYIIAQRKIVLRGSPKVYEKGNTLTGKVITFYRDVNRVEVDGNTRLDLQNPGALNGFTPKPAAPQPSPTDNNENASEGN